MKTSHIMTAEIFGSFVLVFAGVGAAILGGNSFGLLGVALAFGLAVMCMAYTVGPISGCHLNPAVTIAQYIAGKLPAKSIVPYVLAQVIGTTLGALAVYFIASSLPSFDALAGFASNGFVEGSPQGYNLLSVFLAEIFATFIFITVILGTTRKEFPAAMGGIVVGLTLTLMILVIGNVSNASLNPARSFATAVFQSGWAIEQLWMFILVPIVAGVLAGMFHKGLYGKE